MYPKVSSAARRGSPPMRHASSSAGRASEPNDATNSCALRLVWLPSSAMPRSDLASLYRSTVSTSWIRYSPYPSPPSRSSGRSASRSSNLNNLTRTGSGTESMGRVSRSHNALERIPQSGESRRGAIQVACCAARGHVQTNRSATTRVTGLRGHRSRSLSSIPGGALGPHPPRVCISR